MAATEVGHVASRAVDDLYREHGREVYRYAYAVLGNHADAEDVTQTTFLNAYRALGQGVRPRKPSNWLLAIASNAIKQRFRQEQARPREVELDDRIAGSESDEDGPSIGELMTALAKIPPKQRQAIVLREFEGRTYAEMAEILGVTTSALETLLFRARRSLAEELEQQLTCVEAQLAVSKAVDDRLGRKERRRLREHLAECPDCAHFARLQPRHRSALRGLMLVPVPLSFPVLEGLGGPEAASAATTPFAAGEGASVAATSGSIGSGAGLSGTTASAVMGGVALKAAAVVAGVTIAGGLALEGAHQLRRSDHSTPTPLAVSAAAPRTTEAALQREAAALTLPSAQTSVTHAALSGTAPHVGTAAVPEFIGSPHGEAPGTTQPDGRRGALPRAPQTDEPTGDRPTGDQPGADEPQGEVPPGEVPPAEVPETGAPQGQQPQSEQPETGAPPVEPPAAAPPTPLDTQTPDSTTAQAKPKPAKQKQKQKKPKKSKPTTPAATKPAGQQPPGHDQPKPEKARPAEEPQAEASRPEKQPNAEAPGQERQPNSEESEPEKEPNADGPGPDKSPTADTPATASTPPAEPQPPADKAGGQKKP